MKVALLVFWILLALSVLCVTVWMRWRKHSYLSWWAAALLLLGAGVCAQAYASSSTWQWVAACLFGSAAVAAAQTLLLRFGRVRPWQWVAGSAVLVAVGSGVACWLPVGEATWRWVVVLGCGAVLAVILPSLWRSPVRHSAERVLRAAYTALVGLVCLLPLVPAIWGAGWAWWMLLIASVLTAAVLACLYKDRADSGRPLQRGTADTGWVLDRKGLERASGKHPFVQGINVLVVCEVDLRSPHAPYGSTAHKALLRRVGGLLQGSVREGDLVADLGEGAFVLALRNIDMPNAQALVQRIQVGMQQRWAKPSGMVPMAVASFGLAMVREVDTLPIALHRAEVLMFQAKERTSDGIGIDEVATEAA